MPLRLLLLGKGKVISLAASISGLLGFTLTEALTSQWGLAAISTVIASLGGAVFVAIPKIIVARAEAKTRESVSREIETSNLIDRMNAFQSIEIQFYQRRLDNKELVCTLERKSKHKALSECQRLVFQINFLEDLVRRHGGDPPAFRVTPYEEIVGEEDRQIEAMANLRITEEPPSYGAPAAR